MRHCVWQCELTQKRGKAYAYLAGQAHELNSADDLDRQADLFNNQCGRALGANNEADCEAECEKLWNEDGLAKNK